MAREMKVVLTDDIDGTEAAETVSFGLDQGSYEIELSAENAAKLREVLAPFIAKARRVAARPGARRSGGGRKRYQDTSDIREWARNNGYTIGDRGRIPAEVEEAYRAANS